MQMRQRANYCLDGWRPALADIVLGTKRCRVSGTVHQHTCLIGERMQRCYGGLQLAKFTDFTAYIHDVFN